MKLFFAFRRLFFLNFTYFLLGIKKKRERKWNQWPKSGLIPSNLQVRNYFIWSSHEKFLFSFMNIYVYQNLKLYQISLMIWSKSIFQQYYVFGCLSRKNVIQMNIRDNFLCYLTETSEQVTITYKDARLLPINMCFYILLKESESLKILNHQMT